MASSSPRKTLSDPAAVFPQESSDRLLVKTPKRVVLSGDVGVVADALKHHYSRDQLQALIDALSYAENEGSA